MSRPGALRHALAGAGVRPGHGRLGLLPAHVPSARALLRPSRRPGIWRTGAPPVTITPSAIPAGSKLSIGYFPVPAGGGIYVSLVPKAAPADVQLGAARSSLDEAVGADLDLGGLLLGGQGARGGRPGRGASWG